MPAEILAYQRATFLRSTDWHRAALIGQTDRPHRYNEFLDVAKDYAQTHPYYQELQKVAFSLLPP